MTPLWAVISDHEPQSRWRGAVWEADTAREAVLAHEENGDSAGRVFELVPEKVLVKKWVEEEV